MKEEPILGIDMVNKLIPFLNLDPDKLYTSITIEADIEGFAMIEATTYVSEKK